MINNNSNDNKKLMTIHLNEENCSIFNQNHYKNNTVEIDDTLYPQLVSLHESKQINFDCLTKYAKQQKRKRKQILYWNEWFESRLPFVRMRCPLVECEILVDRDRLDEADLVVVAESGGGGLSANDVPSLLKSRSRDQQWVYMSYESYSLSNFDKPVLDDDLFTSISSYTLDADFPGFYSSQFPIHWQNSSSSSSSSSAKQMNNKEKERRRVGAALISNCGSLVSIGRMDYLNELSKHTSVDVFGKCGKKSCAGNDCAQFIYKNYLFYFAFENSICRDYITEKFFKILREPIVPVVLGGGSYHLYIPRSGYIDARDFARPRDLAIHLNYLAGNATAYDEYFKWKQYVSFGKNKEERKPGPVCDMCISLHLRDVLLMLKQKQKQKTSNLNSTSSSSNQISLTSFLDNNLNLNFNEMEMESSLKTLVSSISIDNDEDEEFGHQRPHKRGHHLTSTQKKWITDARAQDCLIPVPSKEKFFNMRPFTLLNQILAMINRHLFYF